MNGPIAQAVALVCHANAALRGLRARPLFPDNSTCQFAEFVRFVVVSSSAGEGRTEREVAADPDAWFQFVRNQPIRRVWLAQQGDGGHWWVLTERADGAFSGWLARWEVGDREATNRRIWRVTYGMFSTARMPPPTPGAHDLAASRNRLVSSLESIFEFSNAHAGGSFAEQFTKALATLRTGVRHGYHTDLAPAGTLSQAAADLLDACQSAWVFGGMSWWNDQAFDGALGREFERVTVAHFGAVCDAITVAANASAA